MKDAAFSIFLSNIREGNQSLQAPLRQYQAFYPGQQSAVIMSAPSVGITNSAAENLKRHEKSVQVFRSPPGLAPGVGLFEF